MQITLVKPMPAFIKIVCQSLQNAYIILIKNTLEYYQDEESDDVDCQNTKVESSLMESSESFISYNTSETSYSRRSSVSSSRLSQIFEDLSEECSGQITFSSNHTQDTVKQKHETEPSELSTVKFDNSFGFELAAKLKSSNQQYSGQFNNDWSENNLEFYSNRLNEDIAEPD